MDALTRKINDRYSPEEQQAEFEKLTPLILDMKDHFQLLKVFSEHGHNEENSTFFHYSNGQNGITNHSYSS